MTNTEWKEYTVQELIDLDMLEPPLDGNHGEKHPKSTDYVSEGIPFVMANDLTNGSVDLKNCYFITQQQADSLDKGFAKPGDVLLTHKATLGRTAIVPDTYPMIVLTPQVTYYRCKKGIHNKYLKYYFDSPSFQQLFQNWAGSGSTRLYLGITAQRKLPIVLPPLAEQQRIAKILSSLDEKIELNNAINRNLEEQAQILFKNYEENKPSNLMKIADVAEINPDSFGLKDDWSFVNYLDTSSITQNVISELQYINLNEEKLPSRAKRKVMENDIVYSTVRPNQLHFGFINEVKPNMLVSTGFAVIRSKNPLVSNEYIYLNLTKRDTIEKLQQIAEQSVSTFPAIKPSDIGDCLINVFEKKDAEILNDQLSAVFKKISQNNQENQRLALIRDSLLPKLMSGEMELGC